MRSRRAALRWPLLILLSLPAAGVLLGLLAQAGASRDLAAGRERLLAGDRRGAADRFDALRSSPFLREQSRAGRALVAALTGQPGETPAAAGLTQLPLREVFRDTLASGDLAALERAAALAGAAGLPLGTLFEAAARSEAGDDGRALALLAELPAAWRSDPLAVRIAAAAQLSAAVAVWDRRGEAVGRLEPDGSLRIAEGVEPELIPKASQAELAATPARAGLRLSVDLELSRLARAALGDYRGSILLLDAWSGSVLAAVSDERSRRELETPALEQYREPASIAKLITTAAALRAGLDPDAEIARISCNGAVRYPSGILWCPWGGGRPGGLDEAMAVSCNTSFAELGARVGRQALVAEFRRWGFDRDPRELPGSGRVVHPEGDARQLGDLAIGLEASAITPLHAALLAAVFANGGAMPSPRFVVAADGRLGMSPAPLARPAPLPVIPAEWLPRLRGAMLAVTRFGTAAGLAPADFPAAMKTGTAAEPGAGYHVNYIGIGAMPDARLAFCVRITHQRNSRTVRRAARFVTGQLLESLAAPANRIRWPGPADPASPGPPAD